MPARAQIEEKIRSAADSVIQQVIDTDDSIAGAVVGRNTNPYLAINGSFLYRDGQALKTLQSHRRLTARLTARGRRVSSDGISILDTGTLRSHYRIVSVETVAANVPLAAAVTQELASIGDLIFILIGKIKGLRPYSQAVESAAVKEIRLEPSATTDFRSPQANIFAIRKLLPVEDLLTAINNDLQQRGGLTSKDRQAVAKAYEKMLDSVTTEVEVPGDRVVNPAETILGTIAASVRTQTREYDRALQALHDSPEDRHALYEVLRIAYNFSTDVLPLIYLFVSICDLKPLVFWCTVKQHWALYRAFADLPWSALGRKESLEGYETVISQARSYAFHHVLPFESTIEIDLSGLDVRAERIRLFAPFGQRQDRGLTVKDQKLADVLTEFSRAKQRPVSAAFWQANLKVMRQATELTEQVLITLLLLHQARRE
jgi:hypothetical protein